MAILQYHRAYPHDEIDMDSNTQPVNIEAWTEQAAQSLAAVTLAPRANIRGTSVPLTIHLEEKAGSKQDPDASDPAPQRPRSEPLRRDSLKRREALLKGKEGSRRRTRWENGLYHEQACGAGLHIDQNGRVQIIS